MPQVVIEAAKAGRFGLCLADGKLQTPGYGIPLGRIDRIEELAKSIADDSLTGAFVSPPPPLFLAGLRGDHLQGWVNLLNTGMRDACQQRELRPLAYLPMEDPTTAQRVLEELDSSWSGVSIGTHLDGRTYADDEYEPIWTGLTERNLFVFLHPGLCPDARLAAFYLANLLGNPYETALAAAHLLFGGVIERHRNLRILLAHGGGATAMLIGRWQRAYDQRRPGIPDLELSPQEAVKRLYVDSVVHSRNSLSLAQDVFGPDKIVYGSDWPFPLGSTADELYQLTNDERAIRILFSNSSALIEGFDA